MQGYIYILHLDSKLSHARHYVGWAKNPLARIAHHKNGSGARFTQVCNEQGIGYTPSLIVAGDRTEERRIKNTHNVKRYCPHCMGENVRDTLGENLLHEFYPNECSENDIRITDNL